MYAQSMGDSTSALPNSVIYGWQDSLPVGSSGGGCRDSNNKRIGCSHIVKVTTYSAGRYGIPGTPSYASFIQNKLPWIYEFLSFVPWGDPYGILGGWEPYQNWVLYNRDGYVYVSIKRWDQDHGSSLNFPNTHQLWQFLFHRPGAGSQAVNPIGSGLPAECLGYGLQAQTKAGLQFMKESQADQRALSQAFMLNDNGNGQVDSTNIEASSNSCSGGTSSPYCTCLTHVNQLLNAGTESHSCAEYIAWKNAAQSSPANDGPPDWLPFPTIFNPQQNSPAENDYSIKFVDCTTVPGFINPLTGQPPEDLTSASGSAGNGY